MNISKVSPNGQVTIPVEIRRKLNISEGDKIIFLERGKEVFIQNTNSNLVREAQAALYDTSLSEEEILNVVMKIRYGEDDRNNKD